MIRPLVLALVVLALSATGVSANYYYVEDDCRLSTDHDRAIRGCTQIIERGEQETLKNRAVAYFRRGLAYYERGEYDRAIADYTKAIALDPNLAGAYHSRGLAYVQQARDLLVKARDSVEKLRVLLEKLGVTASPVGSQETEPAITADHTSG